MLDEACSHLLSLTADAAVWHDDRGQISAAAPLSETRTYGKVFSAPHAEELLDAARSLDLRRRLGGAMDVLDFGCGHGLSLYALQDSGLTVRSYQGYDHNPNMILDATSLAAAMSRVAGHCESVSFHASAVELHRVDGPCLVLLNHLLGQGAISPGDIDSWSDLLDRITGSTFSLMILDVNAFPDQTRNQSRLFESLSRAPRNWNITRIGEGTVPSRKGRKPKKYLLSTVGKPRIGS